MFLRFFVDIIFALGCTGFAYANDNILEEKGLKVFSANGVVNEFIVEVADNEGKQVTGLMNRKIMDENHGMLFLFDEAREVNMWMKDTYIPLDMVFIKSDNTILKIVSNAVPMSLKTIASEEKVKYKELLMALLSTVMLEVRPICNCLRSACI